MDAQQLDEYLRRNLLVAQAAGAHAGAKKILERLSATRRPPRWLIEAVEGVIARTEALPAALAQHRSEVYRVARAEARAREARNTASRLRFPDTTGS